MGVCCGEVEEVVGSLERRRDAIEVELLAAAGGASLCTISRSAGSVPGVKYPEGRHAAIAELRRAVRAGESPSGALDRLVADWSAQLARARQRQMGADWVAYRAGGVDELSGWTEARR